MNMRELPVIHYVEFLKWFVYVGLDGKEGGGKLTHPCYFIKTLASFLKKKSFPEVQTIILTNDFKIGSADLPLK